MTRHPTAPTSGRPLGARATRTALLAPLVAAAVLVASVPQAPAQPSVEPSLERRLTDAADGPRTVRGKDPTSFTITQTLSALESGRLTSRGLTQKYLARIRRYEPYYNAFTQMNPDALHDARVSDRRRARGKAPRPLEGVPVVVKDTVDMAGFPTTGAWPLTSPIAGGASLMPAEDAPVVTRLKRAGAVIIGKTNRPVWAWSGSNANDSAYGPTYNVLNRGWAPGGSSTGTATAVAGDFAVAGVGGETGGSIQNPAAAQSLVAVKPTFGLIPTVGAMPQVGERDVLGPLVKTVADAATMLDVLAGGRASSSPKRPAQGHPPKGGYAGKLSTHALEGARIGLYGPGWRNNGDLSPETAALYRRAVRVLKRQGAKVVKDPFAGTGLAALRTRPGNGYLIDATHQTDQYLRRLGPEATVHSLEELRAFATQHGHSDDVALNRLTGDPSVAPDLTNFNALKSDYLRIFNQVMKAKRLDALVFPQAVREIGDLYGGNVASTTVSEINIAGLPGVVLPDGSYASGRPFSLMFVGRLWREAKLLSYA